MKARHIDITTSDFRNLHNDEAIYVDKAPLIYDFVHDGRAIFLSRLRRFGMSLLMLVLQAYFGESVSFLKGLMPYYSKDEQQQKTRRMRYAHSRV